ncbi:hypothetical protein HPULCUR_001110 [Helicostylum pulchrum]|uniref:Protein kinase domain-containing protein n=1 Tax=Helicostylum pulchrum TaxID=562976 RepID=A0ABP9XLS2_9FUNG
MLHGARIHSLTHCFLQYKNIIRIKWSEVTHRDIDTTKFDVLGIGNLDDGLVMVLELAGGFLNNDGQTKLDDDTKKLYENVKTSLNLKKNLDKILTALYHSKFI